MTDVALDPQSAFSGTRDVDPRHALGEATLNAWLTENVEGYEGPLTLRQFKGGQSNPTYELATPGKTYVLALGVGSVTVQVEPDLLLC